MKTCAHQFWSPTIRKIYESINKCVDANVLWKIQASSTISHIGVCILYIVYNTIHRCIKMLFEYCETFAGALPLYACLFLCIQINNLIKIIFLQKYMFYDANVQAHMNAVFFLYLLARILFLRFMLHIMRIKCVGARKMHCYVCAYTKIYSYVSQRERTILKLWKFIFFIDVHMSVWCFAYLSILNIGICRYFLLEYKIFFALYTK